MQTTKTPTEVRNFIKATKDKNIFTFTDQQGFYLYLADEGLKLNPYTLKADFKKSCPDIAYSDHSEYILTSLDNLIGRTFKPNEPLLSPTSITGSYKLNTFKNYKPKDITPNMSLSIWIEFLERLFPIESERVVVSQFLAHMFQKPEQRPSYGLLLSSEQGCGKGFLFSEILRPLLANQTYLCPSYPEFLKPFSMALNSTLLCLLDDPKSKSENTMTQLKSKITEEWQTVEVKHEQPYSQQIFTRIILASNEVRPLRLDVGDRRWYAPTRLVHKISNKETQEFITKLKDWLDKGGLDAVYNWFMGYDIINFNHKYCTTTSTLEQMIDNSKSVLNQDVEDWLKDNLVFKWKEYASKFEAPPNQLQKLLIESNFRKTKANLDNTTRTNWWIEQSLSNEEAKKHIHPRPF